MPFVRDFKNVHRKKRTSFAQVKFKVNVKLRRIMTFRCQPQVESFQQSFLERNNDNFFFCKERQAKPKILFGGPKVGREDVLPFLCSWGPLLLIRAS